MKTIKSRWVSLVPLLKAQGCSDDEMKTLHAGFYIGAWGMFSLFQDWLQLDISPEEAGKLLEQLYVELERDGYAGSLGAQKFEH